MKPTTSKEILLKPGGPIKIRLGDILILDSPLKACNHRDLTQFIPLAVLVVGLFRNEIHFTLLGLDSYQYSISKHTKKGLVLLNKRGKEIQISESHIVRFFKEFVRRRSSDAIDGVHLYLRTVITDTSRLMASSGTKTSKRLIDLTEWPDRSLVTWAKKHLRIPHQHVPRIDNIGNRNEMIDSMIKLSTARAKADPGSDKKDGHTILGSIPILKVDDRPVSIHTELTWGLNDCRQAVPARYNAAPIRYNTDMEQQEKVVIENMGEASFEIAVDDNGEPEHVIRDDQGERSILYRYPDGRFISRPEDIARSVIQPSERIAMAARTADALRGSEAPDPAINEDDPDEIR